MVNLAFDHENSVYDFETSELKALCGRSRRTRRWIFGTG